MGEGEDIQLVLSSKSVEKQVSITYYVDSCINNN